jgi:hypothetical protein
LIKDDVCRVRTCAQAAPEAQTSSTAAQTSSCDHDEEVMVKPSAEDDEEPPCAAAAAAEELFIGPRAAPDSSAWAASPSPPT